MGHTCVLQLSVTQVVWVPLVLSVLLVHGKTQMGPEPGDSSHGQSDPLSELLKSMVFKNSGTVKSTDEFVWQSQPCSYLESQNTSTVWTGWDVTGKHNYLYQRLANGSLVAPPSGMRSSVPVGGVSTGSVELRADGSLHEWTIINQTPAGAAKFQTVEALFAIRTQTKTKASKSRKHKTRNFKKLQNQESNGIFKFDQDVGVSDEKVDDDDDEEEKDDIQTLALRTHPPDPSMPGVESLRYQGAHPMSRLDVLDSRLPVNASLYAYSTYLVNQLNISATPAAIFSLTVTNPSKSAEVDVSFMFNMPLGIETNSERVHPDMPQGKNGQRKAQPFRRVHADTELHCFKACLEISICQSWSYYPESQECAFFKEITLNTYRKDASSGIKGFWATESLGDDLSCVTLNRPGNFAPNGNLSVCPTINNGQTMSLGISDDFTELWSQFASTGRFETPKESQNYNVNGAASVSATLAPGETKTLTIIMAWYYPNRDFQGKVFGNFYANILPNSQFVAEIVTSKLVAVVADIKNLHLPFFDSSLPEFLSDMYINSLSHIRSAMWFKDGRWRQWEAYDCVNIDSVHNDGERHIPYIMLFPQTLVNKMEAWALSQNANGMIDEELRWSYSCSSFNPPSPELDVPGGRVLVDVTSMFIVYLLELYQWGAVTEDYVKRMYPVVQKAAQWHMDVSKDFGLPRKLQNTYDVLGLNAYDLAAYNSAFHLLAMRAAEEIAKALGDTDSAATYRKAYLKGQGNMDVYQWNQTSHYYNAYTMVSSSEEYRPMRYVQTKRGWTKLPGRGQPAPPGAIMTDSFYAQVLAFTNGLGVLPSSEEKLSQHLDAELEKNDSPLGMLVLTGRYPYPGPSQDNCVWLMGNPNWAALKLHLGADPGKCLSVAEKTLDRWRSVNTDQWNVAGLMGGLGYGADGQPWATSHYGYYMSSWHILFALTGQQANLPRGTLTFDPKVTAPYRYPVLLPGILGSIVAEKASEETASSVGGGNGVKYTLTLTYGRLKLTLLSVSGVKYPSETVSIAAGDSVSWP